MGTGISYELAQKGIEESIIFEQLLEHREDWLKNTMYLIAKKSPKNEINNSLNDKKQKNKITRFLIDKGYDYATIRSAFKILSEQYD